MIQVERLCKFYGNHRAIDDVSFRIEEGEIVGLLGLNGAGKSTILKILATYLTPTKGDVIAAGYRYDDDLSLLRKSIGYLPDRPPLYEEMRTGDYLKFAARLRGVASRQVDDFVEEAIKNANLEEVRGVHLGHLSHGFRQRVGIAQAIIHKPKILILDEPINGLDPIQIVEMRDLILSLKGQYTVILSSHILSEITQTCDRIIILDQGKLVAEGSETQLRSRVPERMTLKVDWRHNPEAITAGIKNVAGVLSTSVTTLNNLNRATIKIDQDVRGAIAATIVSQGGELLGLSQVDQGLEDLFMKLIHREDA